MISNIMPRTYTKQELEERYKKLPPALKEAIFSPDVAEKMFEIGKKNGLTIEKTGFMAEETGFVILGLTRPREFVGILTSRLAVEKEAAQKIASDINREIFSPLREALKSAHQIDVNEQELQKGDLVIPKPASEPKKETPSGVPQEKSVLPPPSPSQPAVTQEKIDLPQSVPWQSTVIPQASPQPIPRQSPAIPPPVPQAQLKNAIDLRQQENQESRIKNQARESVLPPPPRQPSLSEPPPIKPTMPPPIVIPPSPKPQMHPLQEATQNPKIPPIDLRNTPMPASMKTAPATIPPAPEKSKSYPGHDPYREPIE